MATDAAPPREGLLERVRALVPMIADASSQAEAQRRPVDEVIDVLERAGVFRAFVPARYGGYELDLSTFVDIGIEVAEVCPSTSWITTFYMEHNWLLTLLFAEETQDEIFAERGFVLAPGTVNPNGRATANRDGSYELTGQWPFGTGVMHADWVILSGVVSHEEREPEQRMFLARRDEIEVKDTWHVDGMVGTGSNDIVATSLTVPPARVSGTWPPEPPVGDPTWLSSLPVLPMLSLTAAIPSVGCARRAVQLFRDRMFERVMYGTAKAQSKRIPAQMKLANLITHALHAETLMRAAANEIQHHADARAPMSRLEQLQLRLAIAHVVRMCRDVVRDALEVSGAKAHFLDNELQRIHRDIHMLCGHTVFDIDLCAETVGRELVDAQSVPAP